MGMDPVVLRLRQTVPVTGFPSSSDTWHLADHLGPGLRAAVTGTPEPYCCWAGDRYHVTLPAGWSELRRGELLLAEIGRYLVTSLAPELLSTDPKVDAQVRDFVLAWKLPLELLCAYADDQELLSESGVSIQELNERRRLILGGGS